MHGVRTAASKPLLTRWHTRGTRDGTSRSLVARRHAPLPITSDHGVTGGEKQIAPHDRERAEDTVDTLVALGLLHPA